MTTRRYFELEIRVREFEAYETGKGEVRTQLVGNTNTVQKQLWADDVLQSWDPPGLVGVELERMLQDMRKFLRSRGLR